MISHWITFVFGSGLMTLWHGALFAAFAALMGTGVYACQDPSGPSAAPLMVMSLFFLAFVLLAVASPVNCVLWAAAAGYALWTRILLVPVTWAVLGLLWLFLVWASDPNYPQRLVPGRILFFSHSVLIYAANLWWLWRVREQ
jgi:hypothetical protein